MTANKSEPKRINKSTPFHTKISDILHKQDDTKIDVSKKSAQTIIDGFIVTTTFSSNNKSLESLLLSHFLSLKADD